MPEDVNPDGDGKEVVVPEPATDIQPEGKEVPIVPEGEKAEATVDKTADDKLTKLEARLEALELEKTHWHNKANKEYRQRADLEREVAKLRTSLPTHVPPEKEPVDRANLDKLVEAGDWDKAVEKIADRKVEEKLTALQQKHQRDRVQADRAVAFQQAQSEAVFKYPDLANDDAELTEFYLKVLDKYPQYRNEPNGPLLTMHKMEEEAMRLGVTLTPSDQWQESLGVKGNLKGNKEVARRAKAQAGSIGAGRGGGNRTYVLSKEQQEVVRNSGLDEKAYARVASQLEGNGGVEA